MIVAPSDEVLAQLRAALAARDEGLARAHAAAPAISWRRRENGFPGLIWMIVGQQVSTASAAAIWGRVEADLGVVTPETVLARDVEGMRELGLSLPKARYAVALAESQASGAVDLDALGGLSDAEASEVLLSLKGIGRWTAETYLMFCEGRIDVFPGGDIALQEAMRWADRLDRRPSQDEAYARAEAWGPHRSVAAHLLWAWYGAVRRGETPHPLRDAA